MSVRHSHVVFMFLCGILLIFPSSGNSADSIELTRNGASSFHIGLPADASPRVMAAAETLRRYIEMVSGADLRIIQTTPPSGDHIVFEIGEVVDLGEDGFRIRTIDNNLYLSALTDQGIQNAVYTFLETYLGCRKYSLTFEVIPHTPTIVLPPIDDTQIPVITFRMQDIRDSSYDAWHKLDGLEDWGLFVHTFKTLVPAEKYFKDHPEYFSENNGVRVADGQLCLTNPDVFNIVVDELRRRMNENPTARFWSVSQNDTYVPCGCAACRAIDSVEGSPSGSILSFVNRVAAKFPEKTISTLAYIYSRGAPDHLRPASNVNVMLCSIECNRSRPIAEDPGSASFVKDVKDWASLTHNIFLWDYVVQFRNLVSPFPNLRTLQPNMQFFAENGITSVFEQGVADMQGEFAEQRVYLLAKLLWNPYLSVDSVMDDFLRGYYGSAASYIREYIDTMHGALASSGEELSCYGYPYPSENGYLSAKGLDQYEALFAEAEAAVQDDSAYLLHVQTAHLPVQYAILEQAKMLGFAERGFFVRGANNIRKARPEMESLLQVFVDHCISGGITRLWEHGNSPEYYLAGTRKFIDGTLLPHLALERPVILATPASTKYRNGEAAALTDGLIGWDDYHFHWLGFEGNEMTATIDLGSSQAISRIETNFLQDLLSWVFMPQTVEYFVSDDNATYRNVGMVQDTIPPQRYGPIVAPFAIEFAPVRARFIRVQTESFKTCPAWHKGAGGKAWIFIDEIKVF